MVLACGAWGFSSGVVACRPGAPSGGGAPSAASTAAAGGGLTGGAAVTPSIAPLDPVELELWTRAKGFEADDLARLADHEGAGGLVTRASAEPAWRPTAIRAMAFAPEPGAFEELPWLARNARTESDPEAAAALDSVIDLAARPRRAIDPEDAAELREGCDLLLALAKDAQAPRARRIASVRALRMLSDRGCVKASDVPSDLDIP